MGKIDDPHDPEDEGQSRREQRVEAAQEHALDDRVDPADHAVAGLRRLWRISEMTACHAPLQAGHPVTPSFDTVFQKQPRWLLDRPVKPGDDSIMGVNLIENLYPIAS